MNRSMLQTALVEDLNRLACAEEQDRYSDDPDRAREALDRLRFPDLTELERYQSLGWLDREEIDLIERLARAVRERLRPVPDDADPIAYTHGDPGWQVVRERALELVVALDAFIDLGVPGWGRTHGHRGSVF